MGFRDRDGNRGIGAHTYTPQPGAGPLDTLERDPKSVTHFLNKSRDKTKT
jgi:hypothetical protein